MYAERVKTFIFALSPEPAPQKPTLPEGVNAVVMAGLVWAERDGTFNTLINGALRLTLIPSSDGSFYGIRVFSLPVLNRATNPAEGAEKAVMVARIILANSVTEMDDFKPRLIRQLFESEDVAEMILIGQTLEAMEELRAVLDGCLEALA